MILEGKKVLLKPIRMENTKDIIRWRNQPFVRDKFICQELFTEEVHLEWLRTMVNTGRVHQFIIYPKYLEKELPAIGSVYLRDVDEKNLRAEFGIFIGEKEYLGKGYGSDATDAMLNYAFKTLKLHKIRLRVLATNKRAIESYKRSGFVEEGYFKDEIKRENGFLDIIFMSVIK